MEPQRIVYDKMVIGRYAPILTKNCKVCNEKLASGMSMEEFIEFDYKFYEYFTHGHTPHLVVEYIVNGQRYYHALEYPRNSPIIQKGFFGKELIVVYRSDNPWIADVRTDLKVEKVMADTGLQRSDFSGVKPLDNMHYYGLGFTNGTQSPLVTPLNTKSGTTQQEKTALILSIISLVPPVLGSVSLVTAIIALVMSIKAEKQEDPNHAVNHTTRILAVLSMALGVLLSGIYFTIIVSIVQTILERM